MRFSVFVLTLPLVLACATTQPQPADPVEPAGDPAVSAPADSGQLSGKYQCHLTIEGTTYPAADCEIAPGDLEGVLWIEKLQGTQRFAGEVKPSPEGFSFAGYFYCPQGACDEEVNAVFEKTGSGYEATIKTAHGPVTVTLTRP